MKTNADIVFEAERKQLLGLCYRILGSRADAEDVVQDVAVRWLKADIDEIRNPVAWLRKACTHRSIDQLRKRERLIYTGEWLPEPIETDALGSAEQQIIQVETVQTAFLITLDRLGAHERAAFILHQVFGHSYKYVAQLLGKSEVACRKSISRARAKLKMLDPAEPNDAIEQQKDMVVAFTQAVETGDTAILETMLVGDVVLRAAGGGKVLALEEPMVGRSEVCAFVAHVSQNFWAEFDFEPRELNASLGLVGFKGDQAKVALMFQLSENGPANQIFVVRNPDKLCYLRRSASQVARLI